MSSEQMSLIHPRLLIALLGTLASIQLLLMRVIFIDSGRLTLGFVAGVLVVVFWFSALLSMHERSYLDELDRLVDHYAGE